MLRGRLRLLERIGALLRFSPEGRPVRVWLEGMPGGDQTEVVEGTVVQVVPAATEAGRRDAREAPPGAIVELRRPLDGGARFLLAVPSERGFGLAALWFSFIAVEARSLPGLGEPPGASLGRLFIRLGGRPHAPS